MSDGIQNLNRAMDAEQRCRVFAHEARVLKERIAFLRSALVATASGIESNLSREFLGGQVTSFLEADEERR